MAAPGSGVTFLDHYHVVEGLAPATPSSSTPDYINLKNAAGVDVVIHVVNGSTVTGSAITLLQATSAAAGGEKALAFTKYFYKTDTGAADAPWSVGTAASNTFTTFNTNTKNAYYVIPVDPATLDTNNSFAYVRAGTANAVNTTISVHYIVRPKYAGNPETTAVTIT